MSGNALLTETQRDFLQMSQEERAEEYTKQQRYYHRSNIIERVHSGILDFSLIFRESDDRDLKELFDPSEIDNASDLRRGMRDTIALFILETWMGKYDNTIEPFDLLLQEAVWDAKARRDGVDPDDIFEQVVMRTSVVFDILEPEPVNVLQIADKIDRHALYELTEREFRFYILVQMRAGEQVREGEEAAKKFLENIEELTDQGKIEVDYNDGE